MPTNIFWLILTVSWTVLSMTDGKTDKVKICAPSNPNTKTNRITKYCDLLDHSKKTRATCVFGTDRLDCLRQVMERKADFTVLEAEDLLVASRLDSSSLVVVSEIRSMKTEPYQAKSVVVVRNDKPVPPDLRGAKLCHPGWKSLAESSSLFTQYLEHRLAPQSCSINISLNEDRLRTSAAYFGPSCKAGVWSEDNFEDARLKRTYSNLCALCDDPGKCSIPDKYGGSGGAVTCLKDGVGDALWATYSDVHFHFKLSTEAYGELASQFSYLCKDGSVQPLNTAEPCEWLARPWPVVAAHTKSVSEVQKTMELLGDEKKSEWEGHLTEIIEPHTEYIVSLPMVKSPDDYLKTIPGYIGASEMSRSNCVPTREITWCTHDKSAVNKCDWIRMASSAAGITPSIKCIHKKDWEGCLEAVQFKLADVTVVSPDIQPIAKSRFNLTTMFYENARNVYSAHTISAVVNKGSKIKKIADLKSQRACMTLHNGFGWLSMIVKLRESKLVSESCGYSGLLHDFFGSVCVTGDAYDGANIPKCCQQDAEETDPDVAALKCLATGGCDVAIVRTSVISENTGGNNSVKWSERDLEMDDFRIICNSERPGNCSLAWSYPSAIMVASQLSDWRYKDIHRVFSQLSQRFVRQERESDMMFTLMGAFQEKPNVIFQDTSTGLVSIGKELHGPNSLEEIMNKTSICSGSSNVVSIFFMWLIALCIQINLT